MFSCPRPNPSEYAFRRTPGEKFQNMHFRTCISISFDFCKGLKIVQGPLELLHYHAFYSIVKVNFFCPEVRILMHDVIKSKHSK